MLNHGTKEVSLREKPYLTPVLCDADLEEAALPLEEYASLRDFFVRRLKVGTRPIDPDPHSLVTGNQFLVSWRPLEFCLYFNCIPLYMGSLNVILYHVYRSFL